MKWLSRMGSERDGLCQYARKHPWRNASANRNSWFDADTILLNPKVPWTAFLPPAKFSNIHFLASKTWDGFNSGVFFMRVHEWSVRMLADAQALPTWKPEMSLVWPDQQAMSESFSRPELRDAVVFQPLHWWNEFQLQENMVRDKPNIHPGDLLIHFAGLVVDKAEYMGPWLDKVENMSDEWAVPLENTSYLSNIKEYWDTYGRAKDMLEHANKTLSSESVDINSMQHVVNASQVLQEMLWKDTQDVYGIQNHTELLADAFKKVPDATGDPIQS